MALSLCLRGAPTSLVTRPGPANLLGRGGERPVKQSGSSQAEPTAVNPQLLPYRRVGRTPSPGVLSGPTAWRCQRLPGSASEAHPGPSAFRSISLLLDHARMLEVSGRF